MLLTHRSSTKSAQTSNKNRLSRAARCYDVEVGVDEGVGMRVSFRLRRDQKNTITNCFLSAINRERVRIIHRARLCFAERK